MDTKLTIVLRLDDKKRLPVSKISGCNKILVKLESFTAYQFQLINAQRPFPELLKVGFYCRAFGFSFGKNVSATAKHEN